MQKPAEQMNKYVIIAAGGSGTRMGNTTPKQFLQLKGKSILWYSVKAFADTFNDINIVVVVPGAHFAEAKNDCSEFNNVVFVEGGASRFQSVKNGLAKIIDDHSIVFVHDAVRCLVTTDLINRCYDQAMEKGSAVPSIAIADSVRMITGDHHSVIDRNLVRIIQTPQTFLSDIILNAFKAEESDRFTDEATVVEASGKQVHLIEGEHTNIKITRPVDLIVAEKILEERSSSFQ
jgi:2-C-methyl-D-erythritol 4-phosphate cytidylyltransferase